MSNYLDDMPVKKGEFVRCVANIAAEWITVGAIYEVTDFATVYCTATGKTFEFPSARFVKLK